jgi:hypothetical protein
MRNTCTVKSVLNMARPKPLTQEHTLSFVATLYCETSIHRFRRGSEKETMDPGDIVEIGFAQGP